MDDLSKTLLNICPLIDKHVNNKKIYNDSKQINNDFINLDKNNSDMRQLLEYIFDNSIKTSHPMFLDKLYSGTNTVGVIGELVTSILNTSMYTVKVAPLFSQMEVELINKINKLVGYKQGGGIMTAGGSMGNLMALLCARYKYDNRVKYNGNMNNYTIICSKSSHFSIETSSIIMGLGLKSVIKVDVCLDGSMDMDNLEKVLIMCKEKGKKIIALVLTVGTTVKNGFDDINKACEILNKYNEKCWIHVDGCIGGSLLFSNKYRELLDGLERVDSLTFNSHKMLGIPLQCSMLLTMDKDILKQSFALDVSYLYHDKSEDLGKNTIQCGRKVDALTFWLSWKVLGFNYFRERVDKAVYEASRLYEFMNDDERFNVICKPNAFTLCFYPVGINFDNFMDGMKGKIMIDYTCDTDKYFRVVFNNPSACANDVYDLLVDIYGDICKSSFMKN
jgi:glutamate/tyrosine decarboxylase-like PLP-dependent enzyme